MSTTAVIPRRGQAGEPFEPPLRTGDYMKQPEFHRRYLAYPGHEKFELIGGIVYMASPTRYPHGRYQEAVSFAFGLYSRSLPGVECTLETSSILGEESEPRPDVTLRIAREFGGQSRVNEEQYLEGPPELLAEIAYSSRAIDLHQKRRDYQAAGVQEYLVVCIEERELHWFDFASGDAIVPNRQGVYRSCVFPGLWIHGEALLALDSDRTTQVVQQGLKSRDHAAFVKRLQRARR